MSKKKVMHRNQRQQDNKKSFQQQLSELKETLPEPSKQSKYPSIRECKTSLDIEECKKVETWIPMVGYEHSHRISSMGRVRSIPHVVTDRNGNSRNVTGKIYKVKDKEVTMQFTLEGVVQIINIPQKMGESFYGPGESSLINDFKSFKEDGRPEMFCSLQNLVNLSKKKNITTYNLVTGEEKVVEGGIPGLLRILNSIKDEKYDKPIMLWNLIMAKEFIVDDELGLIITGINGCDNIQVIIRRGRAYSVLLKDKENQEILNSGKILDDGNIGKIWTGSQIKYGLFKVMQNDTMKYRFALGMIKRYFNDKPEEKTDEENTYQSLPVNMLSKYVICSKTYEDTGHKSYKIVALSTLSRYETIIYDLPEETMEVIEKKREHNKKIFGDRYKTIPMKKRIPIEGGETSDGKE